MIDYLVGFVVQNQALIREYINGAAMVLCLTLTIMITIFLWDTWVTTLAHRDWLTHYRNNWTRTPGVPTACALWWIFAAETYRTGAIWWLYTIGSREVRRDNPGLGVFSEAGFWPSFGYLIAGLILIAALLRAIQRFTPPHWRPRVWIFAAVASALFVTLPSIITLAIRIRLDAL